MDFNAKLIAKQYQGFLETPLLWNGNLISLNQLEVIDQSTTPFQCEASLNKRLGKRVEQFVSAYLQSFETIQVVKENIQIQHGNQTIGELDCLLTQDSQPIHLEIIYKFYLYDATVGTTEIDHWIGPNRKDALIQKLDKLNNKQLPLLYKKECAPVLESVDFKLDAIQQKVFFKAQLFVPYSEQQVEFNQLNTDCVCGFYIYQHELSQFTDCKFYMPDKLNWLVAPHQNIDWLSYTNFQEKSIELLEQQTSPLCWLKQPNGEISKFFIVWWEPKAH